MDAEFIQVFIEEAESYLPTLRGGILLCSQKGEITEELEVSMRQAHTIKGAALMTGLNEIGETARSLETDLRKILESKQPLKDEQTRKLLDGVAKLEAEILIKKFETEEVSLDTDSFIENSFEDLQIPELEISEPSQEKIEEKFQTENVVEEDSWGEEDFEIDEEMLEVFALEAEDLLQSITLKLEVLADDPNDRDALLEIRRNAHTLKGSAGIVGMENLSRLAHRVEDLLDYISEENVEANENVFELLLTSTDCLNALAANEISEQLTKKIERLEQEFDACLESLKNPAPKEIQAQEISLEIEQVSAAGVPEKENAASVPAAVASAAENQNPAQAQGRSYIRVSYDRLNELINLVREMVVSRSVFEQRLAELAVQIEELRGSTRRLNGSTAKLETEFEAEMLGEKAVSGFAQTAAKVASAGGGFDALEFDRYTEFHQITRELIETAVDNFTINSELDHLRGKLETVLDYQNRLIEQMRDHLLRLRLISFDSLSARLHRTVKFTAEQEEKLVELEIEGGNLEIDTQILDALVEPLLHLLRNAIAHGIEKPDVRRLLGKRETGKITLRVRSEGMHIIVSIADDGRGISADALKKKAVSRKFITEEEAEIITEAETFELAFLPGLTTAEEISQVAGRGVGLNVVKTAVSRQQGSITVESKTQKGTTFTIRLPMSMAVNRALLVKSGKQTFAFPLRLVKQAEEISRAELSEKFSFGDAEYNVEILNEILGLPAENTESVFLLLIKAAEKETVLAIDEIVKTEEIVIKPLGGFLNAAAEYIGATVLGDGSVVPVLDLVSLLKQDAKPEAEEKTQENPPEIKQPKVLTVMIVDDSPSVRKINSKLIKNAGMQPFVARDGLEALEVLQIFQEPPDVILTDVEMPRMNGYELLAALRQQENLRDVPIIMITSRAGDKHRQKAFELGVSEYVTKPYEEAKLIEIIRRLTH